MLVWPSVLFLKMYLYSELESEFFATELTRYRFDPLKFAKDLKGENMLTTLSFSDAFLTGSCAATLTDRR